MLMFNVVEGMNRLDLILDPSPLSLGDFVV